MPTDYYYYTDIKLHELLSNDIDIKKDVESFCNRIYNISSNSILPYISEKLETNIQSIYGIWVSKDFSIIDAATLSHHQIELPCQFMVINDKGSDGILIASTTPVSQMTLTPV